MIRAKVGIGIGLRHRDPDVADRQADSGADFEKLQTDGPALGILAIAVSSPRRRRACMSMYAAEEPGADWRASPRWSGPRNLVQLLFLDTVLHVAPRAVEVVSYKARAWKRGGREVTMNRGLAPLSRNSALPTTRARGSSCLESGTGNP